MSTIAVTGAASGIGAAVCKHLEAAGHTLIRVDLRNADVNADLSSSEGRQAAIEQTLSACNNQLDAVVACAGVGVTAPSIGLIVGVNYFGVTEYLNGLEDALSASGKGTAVIIGSVAGSHMVATPHPMAEAMLDNDETKARQMAEEFGDPAAAYAASKYAVTVFGRRKSVEWGKRGMRLNIIAPGAVETPLHQASKEDARFGEAVKNFVAPMGRAGIPDEIAHGVDFLLSDKSAFVNGSVLFIDGGMDAMVRANKF
ncbi:SDR family oxidoreductase [Marinobacterium sediminicola]|uniref:NAD(P)-dependent dehydrogenase, short-chain alcohol dehydrogenase family n=1 Tax=Marinobacterium sediminicola TaxID=518898 RepID=A0ABY1S4S5_9GAMM|nr:SDR family oxidoreductase [Marinobacterium sediminicola]ULG70125.1 SDR family oxidoreductase [Marinobacterium sediminicola]SMR78400.1 NAD(P)-dependent dehydrogenase, short-chain alcohol dehydrogenase family [Marinobacterium sediminicola]